MRNIVSIASIAATIAFTLPAASSEGNSTTTTNTTTTTRALAEMWYGLVCGLDIKGGDVTNFQRADPVNCMQFCLMRGGPTFTNAVTWTDYQGGTCWCKKIDVNNLKKYLEPKPGAVTVAASQLPDGNPKFIDWAGWDFQGNDIGNVPVRENVLTNCANYCIGVPGCHAFSWTEYNGGTCWLKSAGGNITPKMQCIGGIVLRKVEGDICGRP